MTTIDARTLRLARVKAAQVTAAALRRQGTNTGWLTLGAFHFRIPQGSRDSLVVFHAPTDSLAQVTARMVDPLHPEEVGLVGLIVYAGECWRAEGFQPVKRD